MFSSVTTRPGPFVAAADAASRLDVFGGGLRLAEHAHQAQAGDVQTDRDHVRRDRAVDPLLFVEADPEPAARLSDLVGRDSRGEFHDLRERPAIAEEPRLLADAPPLAVALERVADLFFEDPPRAAELAEAVEVSEHGHVRVDWVLVVLVSAGLAVQMFGGAHQRQPDLAHDDLRVATLRCDADVAASRSARTARPSARRTSRGDLGRAVGRPE